MCIFCKEFLIFYPSFCLVQSGGQMPRNFRGFWSPKKFDNFSANLVEFRYEKDPFRLYHTGTIGPFSVKR